MTEEHKKKIGLANKGKLSPRKGKKRLIESVIKTANSNRGKKRTLAQRNRMSQSKIGLMMGEKNPLWKGGITPINAAIRTSREYKLWRTAVFERDGYACIWGGKEHGSKLNADHIKPFSLFPELRFAIDNGRTLCLECHKKTDTYGFKLYNKKYE